MAKAKDIIARIANGFIFSSLYLLKENRRELQVGL